MMTCDLEQHPLTLEELLQLASGDAVRVIRGDGHEFIIAPADTFEEEVARLGNSKRFMRFLEKRSKNRTGRSLEEVERDLNLKVDSA
jgi:bifunctional DNA-binding transcriptional regulator/antitoxin component of YhaV-PrlF toxin-antitoxin module